MAPQRKTVRLPQNRYGAGAYYFITVCTKNRARSLGTVTGEAAQAHTVLSSLGRTAEQNLLAVGEHYPGVTVETYVIMPDHVHMVLVIGCDGPGAQSAATVPRVMNAWKASVSRAAGRPVWQRSYYEHVIRGQQDHDEIARYIENNPRQWVLDGKG